jgi:hypothetical protein
MVTAQNLLNEEGSFVLTTPLKIVSFNATADISRTVDIRDLFAKIVFGKDPSVYEVTGRSGQFQPVIKYIPGFPLNVIRPRATPNAVEVKLKSAAGSGQLVVIYKTGKIRLQGIELDTVTNFVKKYLPTFDSATIKFNNTTAVFGTNLRFMRLDEMPKMEYEPDISPFGVLRLKSPKCTFIFTTQGVIHILGATDVDACFEWIKDYLYKAERYLRVAPTIAQVKTNQGKVARKGTGLVTRKGTTCPKDRCPDPYSYEGKCKAGYFVRPNPQMFPCCYQSKRIKADEVRRAYQNAGVEMPNSIRRLIGNKSPSPVAASASASPSFSPSPSVRTSYDERGALKIGTRQCSRYTLEQLKHLAARMKIDTTRLKTKTAICAEIMNRFPPASPSPFRKNFSLNGANYALTNKNGKLFINRRVPVKNHQAGTKKGAAGPRSGLRECSTIVKADLLKYAKALGRRLDPKMTKLQICSELMKSLRARSPSPRSPSASSSAGLSNFERNLVKSLQRRSPSRSPNKGSPSRRSASSSAGLSNFERNLVNSLQRRPKKLKKMINVPVESL